ncbi:MerR family transcriptional regulator [Endozoicomonas sp.]|uniref:MerR family transcriptional regulator n=1 Tax=Endozoicomonas sp. TaxID=1892382 RepID=UPI002887F886|nr:MerR family transcriptional regulator [Endozoicomonas sp.]
MQDLELRTSDLPAIPGKRYFTIGEVSELCFVKSHVLRYWEQEFAQLSPVRRGNRRYYRHEDVHLVRQIRSLLYDQRFTIDGARTQLKHNAIKQKKSDYRIVIEQTISELESVVDILT